MQPHWADSNGNPVSAPQNDPGAWSPSTGVGSLGYMPQRSIANMTAAGNGIGLNGGAPSPGAQPNLSQGPAPQQTLAGANGSQIPIYSAQNPIPQALVDAQTQANAGNDRTLSNWGSWQNTPAAQNVANSYFFDASSPNANGTFGAPSQGSGSGYSGPQPTTNPFTGMPMSAAIPAPPQGLGQGAQPTFSPFPTQGQQALPAPATAPSPQTGQLTSASPQRISQALQQS